MMCAQKLITMEHEIIHFPYYNLYLEKPLHPILVSKQVKPFPNWVCEEKAYYEFMYSQIEGQRLTDNRLM